MFRRERRNYRRFLLFFSMLGIIHFRGLLKQTGEETDLQLRFEREKLLDKDKRQSLRRQRLKTSCLNRSRQEIIPPGSDVNGLPRHIFSHVIVDDENRFLYCEIPKVASSNWKRVLMTLSGHTRSPWNVKTRDIHNKSRSYFRYLNEYSASEIVVRLKTYYKFLFVRDPFERLASAYRNKFVESYNMTFFERTYGRYIIRKFRTNLSRSSKISFKEFINYILDGKSEVMNTHWQLYDELCRPCLVSYDFIGHLEDIRKDSTVLLKILGLEDRVAFPLNFSSNYTVPSSTLMQKYFTELPRLYKQRLYNKYRHDFEMFSYSKSINI